MRVFMARFFLSAGVERSALTCPGFGGIEPVIA